MDTLQIEKLYRISQNRVADVSTNFHRYLYSKADWSHRLISVLGNRGVGKTTMLLQLMRERQSIEPDSLYLSLDSIWLSERELYEIVEYYVLHGGRHLYLDEVHFMDNWQQIIKNLYDDFPRLNIVFTGSSLLRLETHSGDLSRRLLSYRLAGMSFREFLIFEGHGDFCSYSLEELLANHVMIAQDIISQLGVIIPLFEKYLKYGYYPFYSENELHYFDMLIKAVNQVLDSDYSKIDDVEASTIRKAHRMLHILASSTPQRPNFPVLCRELEVDRKQGLKMLYALARGGLLKLLSSDVDKLKKLSTPDKILCGDTNIMYALSPLPDIGTLREVFFMNQLETVAKVVYPKQGDFLVNDTYLFEIGGSGKRFTQIRDIPQSYLAIDNTEIGHGSRIPLWLFGFLY